MVLAVFAAKMTIIIHQKQFVRLEASGKLMEHPAEDFCSDVLCKKCERSGLCEYFLQGAVGQKGQ